LTTSLLHPEDPAMATKGTLNPTGKQIQLYSKEYFAACAVGGIIGMSKNLMISNH
jgi:hypothetical protein